MAIINPGSTPIGIEARKKVGRRCGYGEAYYGQGTYGDYSMYFGIWQMRRPKYRYKAGYGIGYYAFSKYGDNYSTLTPLQIRKANEHKVMVRERFYEPSRQDAPGQIIGQENMRAGVLAWQGLTAEVKASYNERARGLHLSGYTLFLREYLSSL